MHSLRNSPPDCFSQMLMHLEPRVSCTACNSLGSKPPPYEYVTATTPTLIITVSLNVYLFKKSLHFVKIG